MLKLGSSAEAMDDSQSDPTGKEVTNADLMRFLTSSQTENRRNFSAIRSDLSNFESRVSREFVVVHNKISQHDQSLAEMRDMVQDLATKVAEHEEKINPGRGGVEEAANYKAIFDLCDKDEKFMLSKPTYPNSVAMGPTSGSTPTLESVTAYVAKNCEGAEYSIKKRSDDSDMFIVTFEQAGEKTGIQWAGVLKDCRFRSRNEAGVWIGQEYDPAVRVFLSTLNGFGSRLKRHLTKGQRIEWTTENCYLIVNDVVIGSPSMLPPHHRWDVAAPKVLKILDSLPPYYEEGTPPRDQIPMEIANYFLQFKSKPKMAKLQG